ncbi:hypothetical protein [Streptomyces sp. S.PB5]|uniref:hypothetical protein n=1 Tax=Streptomyces sp. S.PB5 TaxID=3020844 RepID=UPI0025AF9CCA|nr:hypothetical protein [Streptomyces sp. S.PB5]MDN3028991.1 hypothetical protein [Streptomyces sp. S.PB5]
MIAPRTFHRVTMISAVLSIGLLAPATLTGDTADATSTATTAAAPGRSGSPTSTVDRVADFYGTYIDVLYDSGHGRLTSALRAHYLTTDLQRSLARWEAVHHRDGVLRAKGVPTAWSVVYNDSGMGHCWSRVTLTWQDPGNRTHRTHLMVQSDLATMLISGIKTDK